MLEISENYFFRMQEKVQPLESQLVIGQQQYWHLHQEIQNLMILSDQAIYFP